MSSLGYPPIPPPPVGLGAFDLRNSATRAPLHLAMQKLWLSGSIAPVGAHIQVQHVFRHGEAGPIEAVYTFALPRDAALRRFVLRGESFEVQSQLKPTEQAREAYEEAIARGSLAAFVREYEDGLVNLSLGNLRPGEEVTVTLDILAGVDAKDDSLRFRFPFTVAPTYHREARYVAAPDGAGEVELPVEKFGDILMPRWFRDASALHTVGSTLLVNGNGIRVSSPSHRVRCESSGDRTVVSTIAEGDAPDRDLVLDVHYPTPPAAAYIGDHRPGGASEAATEWVARVPSTLFGGSARSPMEVVFLLDCSGSMMGLPMQQAKVGLKACLGCLEPGDRFGIVAFGSSHIAFSPTLQEPASQSLQAARLWVDNLSDLGGTEIGSAIARAAAMLRPGGVIVVMTDGQVAGTAEILDPLRGLAVRIHTLGIGSASQDRILAAVAETTHGTSRFVTARERVDREAIELFTEAGERVATAVTARVEGELFHLGSPTVFAGRPLLIYGRSTRPFVAGDSFRFHLTWESNAGTKVERDFTVPSVDLKEAAPLLVGSKRIATLSGQLPIQHAAYPRENDRRQRALATLSGEYGLASQAMSLVAIHARKGDVPGIVPTTTVVPLGLPEDVAHRAYFSGPAGMAASVYSSCLADSPMEEELQIESAAAFRAVYLRSTRSGAARRSPQGWQSRENVGTSPAPTPPGMPAPGLSDLAALLEADGGMPGDSPDDRLRATLHAILQFLLEGHGAKQGPYRQPVRRMIGFVRTNPPTVAERRETADRIVALAEGSRGIPRRPLPPGSAPPMQSNAWNTLADLIAEFESTT